ncbi:hypothetical protein PSCICE_12570 [Pseudomonas cichorii]|nr:hypothetical protein PSCICE_12570 [Pseudomonas cichorii]
MGSVAITKMRQPGITQSRDNPTRRNTLSLSGQLPEQLDGFLRANVTKWPAAQPISHSDTPAASATADA